MLNVGVKTALSTGKMCTYCTINEGLASGVEVWYHGFEVKKVRNIPFFTTENGVASLTLEAIPAQGKAYIRIQSSQNPQALLEEAVGFCKACGAEEVYAAGHALLERYPLHTALWELQTSRESLPPTDACLFPVQEHTLDTWLEIYQEKIQRVPNAAPMTHAQGKEMAAKGEGYFVHRGGKLLGIGRIQGEEILFLASCAPGAGRDVLCALAGAMQAEQIKLTVATANDKAMALYKALGFLPTRELSRWYRIL